MPPRTHRPREQDCSRRPNHRGIPATASSAGDPPLERNPASLPPPIQQQNHSTDGVFTQPRPKPDTLIDRCRVVFCIGGHACFTQTRQNKRSSQNLNQSVTEWIPQVS